MIQNLAKNIYNIKQEKTNTNSKNPVFSDSWFLGFAKRWKISEKIVIPISKARKDGINRTSIASFLAIQSNFITKNKVPAKNVFTADETSSVPKGSRKTKKCGAIGSNLFSFGWDIKPPKVTLLCCVNSEGETIPPYILVPVANEEKRRDSVPVIGPLGYMRSAHVDSTRTGRMNEEKFSFWLHEIFAKEARELVQNNDWIVLNIDNYSAHINLESFTTLHEKKIVIALFPPNTTHVISPLDISVYKPFKTYLERSLGDFSTLSNKNILQWIEPAYEQAFTSKNIQNGFTTSGIWDIEKNCVNIWAINKQYENLYVNFDDDLKRMNKDKRISRLRELVRKELESLKDEYKKLAFEAGEAKNIPSFIQKNCSKNLVDPTLVVQIHSAIEEINESASKEKELKENSKMKEKNKRINANQRKMEQERKAKAKITNKIKKN